VLTLDHVTYRHAGAERDALTDISLTLAPGAIDAVCGAAESGLSTLCHVLGGLAPRVVAGHLRGALRLDGEDVADWPMHRLAEGVVVGLDRPAAQLSMVAGTVYEEVAFGPACLGLPRDEVIARAEAALSRLRLDGLAERDPRRLSGGEQQLVALAGLLAMPARHLVLDEPFRHLDASAESRALEALRGAADGGAGVILTEHRPQAAARVAGTLTLLSDGRAAAQGVSADVLAGPAWTLLAGDTGPAQQDPRPRHGRGTSGTARSPEIRLQGVTHRYASGVTALEGIDLVIPPGQSVGLVGANGSGKTTLLRHLDGLQRPTRGRVLLDGRDTAERTVASLAATVALGFSDPDRQVFARTVRDEVAFGPRQLGRRGDALRVAVDRALASVGLGEVALHHPGDLGASRRMLLALASLLAMGTPVLALDEPTAGLDEAARARVTRLLQERMEAGGTVIVASHDLPFVARTLERVVLLADGRVARDGPAEEVLATLERHETFPGRDRAGT
jgi:energy-coupling factor transport system ATP-binding protein